MEDKDYLAELLPELAKKMLYKWRVQSFSKFKPEATCVAYIDARDVMDRLDKCCTYGWHRNHEELKGRIYAGVGISLPSGNVLWRWDCGTESKEEAEKGESSDSFKRAAVNCGVGRFLYDLKIKRLPANEKKVQGKYPYVIDSQKKRVWDLTEHINGEQKPFIKEEEKDHEWEGDTMGEKETLLLAIESLTTKEQCHKWKKDNEKGIASEIKGDVMTAYFRRIKEVE